MINNQLTREENVQAVFDLKAGYTLGLADVEILKRVARMALAAMDQKPVIVVGDDGGDALSYRRLIQSFAPGTKLYLHAQQPVVPDERDKAVDADDHPLLWSFNEGWNACRAAMLQELQKSAGDAGDVQISRGCRSNENMRDMQAGNSPVIGIDLATGADRTVEVRYVAPPGYVMVPKEATLDMLKAGAKQEMKGEAFQYVWQAMLAAAPQPQNAQQNIPEIIPGWIPVSERMPGSQEWVIVFAKWANQQVLCWDDVQNRWTDFEDQSYYADMFSHWMPLPAAPQEVLDGK